MEKKYKTKVTLNTFNEKNIIEKYEELCKYDNEYSIEFSVGVCRNNEKYITSSEKFATLEEAVMDYIKKTRYGYTAVQLRWTQFFFNDITNSMVPNNYDILAEYAPDLHKEEYINKADYLAK